MLYSRLLPYGIFAISANAQSSSSSELSRSTSLSGSQTLLVGGATEDATPTGDYVSYSSTITRSGTVASAISTSAIVSVIISSGSTRTTTLGSTTLLGFGTMVVSGNSSKETSTPTSSRLLLSGSGRATSSLNGSVTANSTAAAPSATNTTPCNNYPEFCNRKYSNITEVSAHNSPFIKTGNAAANQALDVTTQLNDGIRLLQGQMHFVNSTPHFCHTSCDVLDAGPITDYLSKVYSWVSSHPYDVVTLLLGNGNYSLVDLYVPFIESTGLLQYAYYPPKIPMTYDDWPTLASMILTGKRVVFFLDYDTNQTAYPWFIDEFSTMWETPYDPTDRTFPCTIQRPPNLSDDDAANRFYMANHNLNYDISILGSSLLVPNIPLLNITNNVTGDGSLGVSTTNCAAQHGKPPKFLNVDYYNVGNGSVFEVAAEWNNVTYDRPCCGIPLSAAGILEVAGRGPMFAAFVVVAISWLML